MSFPGDPSHEMYSEDLSPDDVEAMLSSGFGAPADAELHSAFSELRALPDRTPSPAVSSDLAEFFAVHLTPRPEPTVDLSAAPLAAEVATPVHNVRRHPMIGQLAAFFGTLGGKICVGTTVAAASFGGAAATGAVDVPFFEDEPAQVETIELEEPDAVAFVEDIETDPAPEPPKAEEPERVVVEPREEPEKLKPIEDTKVEDEEPADDAKVEDESDEKEPEPLPEEPKPDTPEPTPAVEDKPKVDDKPAEKDEHTDDKDDHDKDDHDKDDEEKHDKDEDGEKTPEEEAIQEQIAILDEALHVAKDAVRAEATALITPLENDRKELVAALETELESIAAQWEPVIDDLEIQLEDAETDEEYLEIEADLEAARDSWEDEHIAAELAADPAIEEIDVELERIELERDEELNRLIAEFLAAVEVLENA